MVCWVLLKQQAVSQAVCTAVATGYECKADLLLGCYVCYSSEAVVLGEGVLVEQHPLRQAQLGALGAVARVRVELGHMFMGKNEIVP